MLLYCGARDDGKICALDTEHFMKQEGSKVMLAVQHGCGQKKNTVMVSRMQDINSTKVAGCAEIRFNRMSLGTAQRLLAMLHWLCDSRPSIDCFVHVQIASGSQMPLEEVLELRTRTWVALVKERHY